MTKNSDSTSDMNIMREMEEDRLRHRLLSLERETVRLKKQIRFFGIGLLGALALAVVAALGPLLFTRGSGELDMDLVRTRQLVLEDVDGTQRGEWRVDEEGNSRLSVFDRQGRTRLSFSVLNGGFPGMSLRNASGETRAALGVLPDESANLVFADGAGTPRTVLGLSRADASHLVFADAAGMSRVALGLDATGEGSVILPGDTVADPGPPEVGGR
jgi:hypothetical protein